MNIKKEINPGVYPVMLTPYNGNGEINIDSTKRLAQWYGEKGCHGIFAACLSSEIYQLSLKERIAVVKATREAIDASGRNMSLVASGHVSYRFEDQVEELTAMSDAGADSAVIITNHFDVEEKGVDAWIEDADKLLSRLPKDLQLGFYECPVPKKRLLTDEMLEWIKSTGRVTFIKDTCCDKDIIAHRLEVLGDSGVKLFNANEQTCLPTFRDGCAGFSGVMANYAPELFVWLFENFRNDPEGAEEVQNFITTITFAATLHYPLGVKYILDKYCGVKNFPMARSAPGFLTEYEKMCMEHIYATTLAFEKKYGI